MYSKMTTNLAIDAPHRQSGGKSPAAVRRPVALRAVPFVGLALAVCALGYWVARAQPYKSGDDLGYNLGLVGGSMMLLLLVYPLRKHVRVLHRLGAMRFWFVAHMILGIAGPLLVVFHSTFKTGSLNGKVALYSMLLVVASGVVGRYVYVHVHHRLHGRQVTLRERENELGERAQALQAVFERVPEVREWLDEYRQSALSAARPAKTATPLERVRFLSVPIQGARVRRRVREALKVALREEARARRWSRAQAVAEFEAANEAVALYVGAVDDVARYSTWVRLFALWHVAHVPLLYLLLLSGIAHVVAVHMY